MFLENMDERQQLDPLLCFIFVKFKMDFLGKVAWRQNLTIKAIFILYELLMVKFMGFLLCLPLQEPEEFQLKMFIIHVHLLLLILQNTVSIYSSHDLSRFMFAFLLLTNSLKIISSSLLF